MVSWEPVFNTILLISSLLNMKYKRSLHKVYCTAALSSKLAQLATICSKKLGSVELAKRLIILKYYKHHELIATSISAKRRKSHMETNSCIFISSARCKENKMKIKFQGRDYDTAHLRQAALTVKKSVSARKNKLHRAT